MEFHFFCCFLVKITKDFTWDLLLYQNSLQDSFLSILQIHLLLHALFQCSTFQLEAIILISKLAFGQSCILGCSLIQSCLSDQKYYLIVDPLTQTPLRSLSLYIPCISDLVENILPCLYLDGDFAITIRIWYLHWYLGRLLYLVRKLYQLVKFFRIL